MVDHHHDKNLPGEFEYADVRFCGSACSLACKILLEEAPELLDAESAFFFAPAIIIDTVFFKPSMKGKKWDDVDHETYVRVNEIAGGSISEEYFKVLYDLKTDPEKNLALGWPML